MTKTKSILSDVRITNPTIKEFLNLLSDAAEEGRLKDIQLNEKKETD